MKEHVQTRLDVLRGEHFLMQQRERLEFRHSTRHWRSGKDRVKSSTHLLTLFHLVLKHGTEHRRASWDRERNKSSEHASIYRKRGVKRKQNAKELLVSLCSEVPKSLKVKKEDFAMQMVFLWFNFHPEFILLIFFNPNILNSYSKIPRTAAFDQKTHKDLFSVCVLSLTAEGNNNLLWRQKTVCYFLSYYSHSTGEVTFNLQHRLAELGVWPAAALQTT